MLTSPQWKFRHFLYILKELSSMLFEVKPFFVLQFFKIVGKLSQFSRYFWVNREQIWRKRENLLTYTKTLANNNIKRITFGLKSKSRTPFMSASCFSKYIMSRASIRGLNREITLCVAAPYETHCVVAHLRILRGVNPSNSWAFSQMNTGTFSANSVAHCPRLVFSYILIINVQIQVHVSISTIYVLHVRR